MGVAASFQTDTAFLARSQLKSVNQSLSSQCEQNKLDTTCQQAGLNPVPRHQGQSTRSLSRSSVRPSARHPRRICALTSPLENLPSHSDEVQTPVLHGVHAEMIKIGGELVKIHFQFSHADPAFANRRWEPNRWEHAVNGDSTCRR